MEKIRFIDLDRIGSKNIGYLTSLEGNKNIPFNINRVYYIYDVPRDIKRGFHAHKNLEQVLICVSGSVKVKCFDGKEEKIYSLNKPNEGLYIGPMVWREIYDYSENTVLMVLASELYNEDDYIRDYDEFVKLYNLGLNIDCKDYFIHQNAIVDTDKIGKNTRIWAFSHLFKNSIIGENCNICEHVLVENDVIIGNNVTIKSGVYIWDGVRIGDNVFIGPSVSFINDRNPRSKVYPEKFKNTVIEQGVSIGANSTIMCDISIGRYATIGAGSVVLKDILPYEIVVGNPARVIGYNCRCTKKLIFDYENISVCECGLKYTIIDNIVQEVI